MCGHGHAHATLTCGQLLSAISCSEQYALPVKGFKLQRSQVLEAGARGEVERSQQLLFVTLFQMTIPSWCVQPVRRRLHNDILDLSEVSLRRRDCANCQQ